MYSAGHIRRIVLDGVGHQTQGSWERWGAPACLYSFVRALGSTVSCAAGMGAALAPIRPLLG